MKIKNIRIHNFKSIYGEQYFDFEDLEGLIKLSGIIGSGKTTLGEAILYGLYGKVKEHRNPDLVSWHTKSIDCYVELNLISKNREIYIKRCISQPLEVTVDKKTIAASNKRDIQEILEEEFYDVPRLAVEKMCIISFNAFKNSLASMTPGETRQFLDDIFGFKTFTQYNDQIIIERKNQINENNQLNIILNENLNQIENLKQKQAIQTKQLEVSTDINGLNDNRKNIIDKGIELKNKKQELIDSLSKENHDLDEEIKKYHDKMTECATLGKQAKNHYNTFKTGKCPTCGHDIDINDINKYKDTMNKYAEEWKKYNTEKQKFEEKKINVNNEYNTKIKSIEDKMEELRKSVSDIDANIKSYNDSVQLLQDNYNELIKEYEDANIVLLDKIKVSDKDIGEWNDMNELFSKTLRYSLLDTLIPHINKSIKFYMNKLNQLYVVEYDQEFKPHIYFDGNPKEISYSDLSTGQKKSLDIGIIFGIIANVISNVEFNIFFLDELFSNMDSESRNIMLDLLKNSLKDNRSIFVVNHAEMADDYFDHKIRVKLEKRQIKVKEEPIIIYNSKYEKIF